MNHMQMICDIGELHDVFTDAQSIEAFLQKIVSMVAKHMYAAVCSVYLYDDQRRTLTLTATKGLNQNAIGKVRLRLGEGLTGLALKELRPINERIGSENPNYKYFPGISEEQYEAFLAVPILRGLSRIGVLVIQRKRKQVFSEYDIVALRAVASQLANMIENAQLFLSMKNNAPTRERKAGRPLKFVKGSVASEGFALGPARIIDRDRTFESLTYRHFDDKYTIEHFKKAIIDTEQQLENLQTRVEEKLTDVASLIFTAHLLLLKDSEFVGAMAKKVEHGCSPPDAIMMVAKQYVEYFSHGTNSYMREKVQDIEDLTIRLMCNLIDELRELTKCEKHIVIARELYPSDLLKLSSEEVYGIILVTGGVTSHLSILARSLKIPLVIIDSPRLLAVAEESNVLLDAEVGNVYINPSSTVIKNFHNQIEARKHVKKRLVAMRPVTMTRDGVRVKLMANINLLSDVKLARDVLCEGIGLYRSEFPFLIRNDFPSEEEQYVVYRKLVKSMPNQEITLRTLDIGGDKVLSYFDISREDNPFLGMRSIRFSLANKEIFKQQIRAMLRAGKGANIRIAFPLISSLEEYLESKAAVYESLEELKRKKIPHNNSPQIGIMVEVPSVMGIIDDLAREADFFSIGTNDFIQYMLAVDRTNEKVASFYIPHHPSILRSLKRIVDAAARYGIEVSVCGDMAHQERYLPFLLGIGIKVLSLEPGYLPKMQELIMKLDSAESHTIAQRVLSCSTSKDITRILS